jgi:hypothetical protein
LVAAGKFDEMFPDCAIPTSRSPAVAQPLDLAQGVGDKLTQLQVFRKGLFHDEPPFECGSSMAAQECIMKAYVL